MRDCKTLDRADQCWKWREKYSQSHRLSGPAPVVPRCCGLNRVCPRRDIKGNSSKLSGSSAVDVQRLPDSVGALNFRLCLKIGRLVYYYLRTRVPRLPISLSTSIHDRHKHIFIKYEIFIFIKYKSCYLV